MEIPADPPASPDANDDPASGPQFPFKVDEHTTAVDRESITREVSEILAGVEDMLFQIARKRARGQLDDDGVEEIVQRCRFHLWTHSLPRFDAARGFKITTY